MFKSPAIKLSFVLVTLTANLIILANTIGFGPNESKAVLELRKSLSESLALQFSAAAERGEFQIVQSTLRAVVERNEDIRSAAIRKYDGKLVALAGDHLAHWRSPADGKSTPTHLNIPVYWKGKQWATVEIRFAPLLTGKLSDGFINSFVGLLVFVIVGSFLTNFLVLKRSFRELDPSEVIPDRVQKAFDVLKEGVLIMDEKEQIVMANSSFSKLLGRTPDLMIGIKGSELGWVDFNTSKQIDQFPWLEILENKIEQKDASLSLINHSGNKIKLAVNSAMIPDSKGKCRGVLVTFDDITELEEKNYVLSVTVGKLKLANEEIKGKSKELEILASCDPMTLCLNRRSIGQKFDILFPKARAEGTNLCCFMVDIDFFKKVNDTYGHAMGDVVIKGVAEVLKSSTRDTDLVSRYGGEEFCVVLPGTNIDKAVQIAERIRQTIEKKSFDGIKVTASQGVSAIEFNAGNPEELVNQADKALYVAKESGRNRVVVWGKDMDSVTEDEGSKEEEQVSEAEKPETSDTNLVVLQNRIKKLEGLLEKRNIELEHYRMYDFKTGLPTRSLFEDRISHEISRCDRTNSLLAVLSISIDTIKRVNEIMGFKVAEQLVKSCGQRLNDLLREKVDTVAVIDDLKEKSSVSLINQTEFGILLTDIKQVDNVTWIVKRILDAFKKSFQIEGHEIYTSAYFGVSIYPHDGKAVEELYSSAINACRYAKQQNGIERYMFSSQELNQKAGKQLRIENLLYEAIKNDELILYYQPKIKASTGRIAGFEALLRWQNEKLGFVPPDQFIPIAEQSGLIEEVGEWVIYSACKQIKAWGDMGLDFGSVAVNISGIQLRQKDLHIRIQKIMDKFDVDPHMLEIELTESSLVNNCDKSFAILKQIKQMGLRLTMDDFGTGYSSLSYLRDIPLSCLKIDKSFIFDLTKNDNADKLVAAIISIAHGLGLEVVAEGVEEKQQVDHLIKLGCEYLQGYYYSRPVPQDEVIEMLQKEIIAQ